jgi:hypothetical protein
MLEPTDPPPGLLDAILSDRELAAFCATLLSRHHTFPHHLLGLLLHDTLLAEARRLYAEGESFDPAIRECIQRANFSEHADLRSDFINDWDSALTPLPELDEVNSQPDFEVKQRAADANEGTDAIEQFTVSLETRKKEDAVDHDTATRLQMTEQRASNVDAASVNVPTSDVDPNDKHDSAVSPPVTMHQTGPTEEEQAPSERPTHPRKMPSWGTPLDPISASRRAEDTTSPIQSVPIIGKPPLPEHLPQSALTKRSFSASPHPHDRTHHSSPRALSLGPERIAASASGTRASIHSLRLPLFSDPPSIDRSRPDGTGGLLYPAWSDSPSLVISTDLTEKTSQLPPSSSIPVIPPFGKVPAPEGRLEHPTENYTSPPEKRVSPTPDHSKSYTTPPDDLPDNEGPPVGHDGEQPDDKDETIEPLDSEHEDGGPLPDLPELPDHSPEWSCEETLFHMENFMWDYMEFAAGQARVSLDTALDRFMAHRLSKSRSDNAWNTYLAMRREDTVERERLTALGIPWNGEFISFHGQDHPWLIAHR